MDTSKNLKEITVKKIKSFAAFLLAILLLMNFVSCDADLGSEILDDTDKDTFGVTDKATDTEKTTDDKGEKPEDQKPGDSEVDNGTTKPNPDTPDVEPDTPDVEPDIPTVEPTPKPDGGDSTKFTVSAEIVNKNGAKGVLTLTSDDGDQRTSDFFYTKVAPKYDFFKITVAVPTDKIAGLGITSDGKGYVMNSSGNYSITGYRTNTYNSAISGSIFTSTKYPTMKEFWKQITSTGAIELASHSHTHGPWPATDEIVYENANVLWPKGSAIKEIRASAQILRNGIGQETPFIMRPGGSFMTTEVSNYFKELVATDGTYLGMRSSNGAPPLVGATTANAAKLNTVNKFKTTNGRLTIATILVRSYEAGFDSTGKAFATTSSSSKSAVKAAGISAWEQYVDYSMEYGQWASIGFHSVVSDSSTATGYEVYDWQVMALMECVKPYVESGDLWLASFSEAAKYYFEWSSAEVSAVNYDEDYIEVKLDDKEEDARFDEALTVKVTVPESWSSAKLTTGGKTANLEIHVDEDGSHFVYANIVPSANISTIRP